MNEYERGYLAALRDVELSARTMPAVGNWHHNVHQGSGRQRPARVRTARLTELGSQHLAILRITQSLREEISA